METQQGTKTLRGVMQEDLEAIEEIHRRDVAATKAGDADSLKSLMDPQCVVFPPDCEPMDGQAYLDQVWPSPDDQTQPDILELVQDWQELCVFGDFAYEQGVVRYAVRETNGNVIRETQQLIRILRRQTNGEWRVYRAIWHSPCPASEDTST
jgi:ketosteroid isomerase-like protein